MVACFQVHLRTSKVIHHGASHCTPEMGFHAGWIQVQGVGSHQNCTRRPVKGYRVKIVKKTVKCKGEDNEGLF
jgi:hypothetical protein